MAVRILGYALVAFSAALVAAPLAPIPRTHRRDREESVGKDPRRYMTMEFITLLADQLRIGGSPQQALHYAAGKHPKLSIGIEANDNLDEIASTLRSNAVDGAEALLKVALFVDLSNRRGTPLIPAIEAIAAGIESEMNVAEELLGEIAGARATAVLMSILPVLIILALHPFHFLFGTLVGRIALVAAVLLNLLGRYWLARITKNALAISS